jgi:hypothetical protein
MLGVSWADSRRKEFELSRARVVPYEVEAPRAGGDPLVVADPPGAVFSIGEAAMRVEGLGGDL